MSGGGGISNNIPMVDLYTNLQRHCDFLGYIQRYHDDEQTYLKCSMGHLFSDGHWNERGMGG